MRDKTRTPRCAPTLNLRLTRDGAAHKALRLKGRWPRRANDPDQHHTVNLTVDCKTRIYVTTLPPCLPHTGEETVGPPKGPPPPKGVRKGVITTFINTTAHRSTGANETKPPNPPTTTLSNIFLIGLVRWFSSGGGTTPTAHPPVRPSGNGISRETGKAGMRGSH